MRRPARKLDAVVVGSLNMDYIARVERLPAPGETVIADELILRFGGKGANQAIAAARQRARVAMIGCVGADSQGAAYLKRLRAERVNTAGICSTSGALCGTALIAVDRSAENTIVVAPGANGKLEPSHIRAQHQLISSARVVLLQFEIPMSCVLETVQRANVSNVPVVLNPSPFRQGFPWGRGRIDTLIVNTSEVGALFKYPIAGIATQLRTWRRALAAKAIKHLVITRGAEPTWCITAHEHFAVPALRVTPVDTVGAGDAFAGAFVAHRAKGADLCSAIGYANCAGALATLKSGAQESIPTLVATERALRKLGWPIADGRREVAERWKAEK